MAASDPAGPEVARFLLFEAVGDALRRAAPVLLVLDDLHWADEPSLRLLDDLAAHVAGAPVLVLGTYRDTEPGGAGLAELMVERRLVLRGLPSGELGLAVAEATGEVIDAVDADRLRRRTGGNPYFAAEVVRLRRAEGGWGDATAVPAGVRAVLERRLDRLPEAVEFVLRAAAVLDAGTTTGVDTVLLGAVAGEPAAALSGLLVPAVEARLLVVDRGRQRFPHSLVAETLTARTPPGQRLELHRRAAATLGIRVRAGIGEPADVAHHLLAAARLSANREEAGEAAASAAVAAQVAMERTAFEDAVAWLEAALTVLADAGAGPGKSLDRGDLLCALGEAALAAGDPARSRRAFVEAAGQARRVGRPELLASAALGLTGGLGGFEVDMTDPARVAVLVEALEALPASDSALRSLVSSRLSVALAFTGDEARRRHVAADAVAMARRVGDAPALAAALAAWCDVFAGPDHVVQRRHAADEIIESCRRMGDRVRELLGRRLRLVALAEAGDWVAVDGEIEAYSRVVDTVGQPGLTWYVPLWRGTRAAMQGDSAAEAAQTAELRRQTERSGSKNAEILELTQVLVRAVDSGTPLAVLPTFDRFVRLAPDYGAAAYCTMALLRALNGEAAEASRLLQGYLEARQSAPPDSEWLPEMVQASMTAVRIEDRAAAATVYAALAPYAGMFAIEGIGAGTWGCVDAYLGRLARLLGRPDDADRHFSSALELDAAAGSALARRTRRWADEGTTSTRSADRPLPEAGIFARDGDVWIISYAGRTVRLRDSKGLRDIAVLLSRPGRDVASYELAGARLGAGSAALDLSDRTAIDAYRRRMTDLEEELAEAEAMHDPVRAEHAELERDALIDELASVTGFGGRSRRSGSDAERIRKAVGNRIRTAVGHVEDVHPPLGRHLRVSLKTGTFCRYEPDREVQWQLRADP